MSNVRGIGFSTFSGHDRDFALLARDLDEAQALAVDFVELPAFSMDLIAGGRIIASQLKRLKAVLSGRSLGVTVHGPIAANFMAEKDLAARHSQVVQANIELAAELTAPHLVIHTGIVANASTGEIEAAYAAQRDALARLGDIAKDHGVVLVIENVFGKTYEHTALPSELAREVAAVGHSHVWACADFSHAAINSHNKAVYIEELKQLAPFAKHLHIHDSFGDPAQFRTYTRSEQLAYGLGDLHLPIGWGALPWRDMMQTCRFAEGAIFNLELPECYRQELRASVDAVREMARIYTEAAA